MPRYTRPKFKGAIYHIICRGNNKQDIFGDDEDKQYFLWTINRYKQKFEFSLISYVLMDNHFHLLINVQNSDISKIMHGINVVYTKYFNNKYSRVGHVLQDRFKSILVNDDRYLLTLTKYIHNNPVRSGMVSSCDEYYFSSYNYIIGRKKDYFKILDTDFILKYYCKDKNRARELYGKFASEEDEATALKKSVDTTTVLDSILQSLNINPQQIVYINKYERGLIAYILSKHCNCAQTEISRILGLGHQSNTSRLIKSADTQFADILYNKIINIKQIS